MDSSGSDEAEVSQPDYSHGEAGVLFKDLRVEVSRPFCCCRVFEFN